MYSNFIFLFNKYYKKSSKPSQLNISLKKREHLQIICIKKIPHGYVYFYNAGDAIIKKT